MIKKARPAGHRVLVKVDELETQSKGGIILPGNDKGRKEDAQITGELVAVGPQAWKEFSDGEPWAKVGDRVLFAKYGGYVAEIDGQKYRVMNDEDITMVVEEVA